jgi:hypothetical protein
MLARMVVKSAVGVLAVLLLAAACGKGSQQPGNTNGSAGSGAAAANGGSAPNGGTPSGGNASTAGSGGNTSAGSAGAATVAGSGGQGGTALVGIGDGELDSTCMMRTSESITGSRIQVRNAVTAEGDKAFIGFYDTEKKIECVPVLDAAGKYRCMPSAGDKDLLNRFFSDDKCTNEVLYKGICADDYEAEPVTSDPCDKRRRIYPFNDPMPDAMVYESQPGGGCKAYSVLNHLYRPGPELVASEYAELKPALWRGKGRIWARGYEGDGGLHLVQDLVDSQLDESCQLLALPGDAERCRPKHVGELRYLDATCKLPLLDGSTTCGSPPPRYAYSGFKLVRAEAKYDGALLDRTCKPVQNPGPAFSTKPVPDSDFLAAESNVVTSDAGRLKPRYLTTADGGCFFDDWWDEKLQTACSFHTPYAGAPYYCEPLNDLTTRAQYVDTFSDSACKAPAPYLMMASGDTDKPPKFFILLQSSCSNQRLSEVRPVEPTPSVPPALYTNVTSDCVSYPLDPTSKYFAAGAIVQKSEFVSATPAP